MIEVAVLVEGETEKVFVGQILAPHMRANGIDIWSRLPGRVRRQGGVRAWTAIRDDIMRTLKERRGRYCSTMFDFNGMPLDWPGREEATSLPPGQRGPVVEEALLDNVVAYVGQSFDPRLFIPYVAVHEFEALLFTDVGTLTEVWAHTTGGSAQAVRTQLARDLEQAGDPEAIDDGRKTAPSKRIARAIPGYRKLLHGNAAAARIGLERIRAACKHFDAWVTRVESLQAAREKAP